MHAASSFLKRSFRALCASAVFALVSFPSYALTYEDYPVVKLRSLDKITARTMTFEVKVGSTVRFGEIFIKVQSCRKPPPVEKSEAAAFLQVWQNNASQEVSKWIFSGWMFASSPALSSMDHPVYDVWVLDCLGRDPEPVPVQNTQGVETPATDGAAPDAVPPAVEPDKAAQQMQEGVTREDDPGAFDENTNPVAPAVPAVEGQTDNQEVEDEPIPSSNMPDDVTPNPDNGAYAPSQDSPETYQDETPVDDSSPVDDTMQQTPAAPAPTQPSATETLEPKPEQPKEFEGIY